MLWLALVGCAGHGRPGAPVMAYRFEARTTSGEIRVPPALQLEAAPEASTDSLLGRGLTPRQLSARRSRAADLDLLSTEVGWALPGEVNGVLGRRWRAQFATSAFPLLWRQRAAEALRTGRDVDLVLGQVARAIGGDAALISWTGRVEATALSTRHWPGSVVETSAGLVVVDSVEEPYLVRADVGMALVTRDGEVVVRYEDTYETVLSATRGPTVAGRDLASALAREVALVWALDPRLAEAEPRSDSWARRGEARRHR